MSHVWLNIVQHGLMIMSLHYYFVFDTVFTSHVWFDVVQVTCMHGLTLFM